MNPLSWISGLFSRNKKQEQPKQQTPRINAAALQQALSNLSNTRLVGAEQLFGKKNITVGSVARATPVLGQAIKFGQNSAGKNVGDFTKGIASAGLEGAQYVAPEVKVFKGAGAGIKLANKFVGQALPSAGLSLASSAVNRTNPQDALRQAAGIGLASGAFNAAPTAIGGAFKGLRSATPYLRNEAGFINPGASVAKFKPSKSGNIEEVVAQVQDLKAQIAGKQQMYQNAKRSIELSKSTPQQKLAQLRQVDDQAGKEVSALQKELGGWQEHMYSLGQKVQGQPLTAPSMPTAPDMNTSTFWDRMMNPLRNERGQIDFSAPIGDGKSKPNGFIPLEQRARSAGKDPVMAEMAANKASLTDRYKAVDSKITELNNELKVDPNEGIRIQRDALREERRSILASMKSAKNERGSVPLDVKNAFTEPKKAKLPIKTRGLVESVKSSPEVSQAVQEAVKGTYKPKANAKLIDNAAKLVGDMKAGSEKVITSLDKKLGSLTDQEVANAITVAKVHDGSGDYRAAADIYDRLAEHLTEAGRQVQAASLLSKQTPEGVLYSAIKTLKRAGVELDEAGKQRLAEAVDLFKQAPVEAKRDAFANVVKTVQELTPQSAVSNLISVWKAGLLSGTKTQGGNFLSNATFGALKKISDVPASIVDTAMSLATGKRSKSFTLKGITSGTAQGVKSGLKTLRTGSDPRDITQIGKYEIPAEINFKNPIVQKIVGTPANLVFRGMKAADQPFYFAALKNNLADLAKVEAKNQGIKGAEARQFVTDAIKNPDEAMLQTATDAANKAVLGFDTFASKAVGGFKQGIEHSGFTDTGKAVARGAVDIIAPFTRVPSAFISRVIDYTPVGIIKTIGSQVAKKEFNQRQLAEAIGEATTGSALVYLGSQLAQSGKLSGDYPTDAKTQAIWKAEGITPNSVKIDGQWINLNYLGPIGLLFGAGKNIVDAGTTGDRNQAAAAVAGLGKGLLGQSFLQGFSGFSDAIKDPQRNLQSFINSQAGSIVPSAVNDIGNLSDTMQRQVNSPGEAVKARIPGLRQDLIPKIDAFGNDLLQASGSTDAAINPLKPSDAKTNAVLTELDKLNSTGDKVFPIVQKTIDMNNQTVKLTPKQVVERQKNVGTTLMPLWKQIMEHPSYASMDDATRKKALTNALSDVNAASNRLMLAKVNPELLTKPATGGTARVLMNRASGTDYVASAIGNASGKGLTPAEDYKIAMETYQAEKASMTAAERFKTEQRLNTLKFQSNYSRDALDIYSMGKDKIIEFFTANPDKKLYDEVLALDKAQISSGLRKKSKLAGKKLATPKVRFSRSSTSARVGKLKIAKMGSAKKPRVARLAKAGSTSKLKVEA